MSLDAIGATWEIIGALAYNWTQSVLATCEKQRATPWSPLTGCATAVPSAIL